MRRARGVRGVALMLVLWLIVVLGAIAVGVAALSRERRTQRKHRNQNPKSPNHDIAHHIIHDSSTWRTFSASVVGEYGFGRKWTCSSITPPDPIALFG